MFVQNESFMNVKFHPRTEFILYMSVLWDFRMCEHDHEPVTPSSSCSGLQSGLKCLRPTHASWESCFVSGFLCMRPRQAFCTIPALFMFPVTLHFETKFWFKVETFKSTWWSILQILGISISYYTLPSVGCTLVFNESPWIVFVFVHFLIWIWSNDSDPGWNEWNALLCGTCLVILDIFFSETMSF